MLLHHAMALCLYPHIALAFNSHHFKPPGNVKELSYGYRLQQQKVLVKVSTVIFAKFFVKVLASSILSSGNIGINIGYNIGKYH